MFSMTHKVIANKKQSACVAEMVEKIYTTCMTTRENRLRSNLRILRRMIQNKEIDPAKETRVTLSSCLWFAVFDRDTASVRHLTNLDTDTNLVMFEINMLWMAVIRENIEIATILVESNADVTQRLSGNGPTFLHFMVTRDENKENLELIKMMIEKGADVNACVEGNSVLHTALLKKSTSYVKILLQHGATIIGTDDIVLASCKSAKLVSIVLGSIDDADSRANLVYAAMRFIIQNAAHNLREIRFLLQLRMPIFDIDVAGCSILRHAVNARRTDTVVELLKYGAKVNKINKWGSFPLLWATTNNDTVMMEVLIQHGANVNLHDNYGRYPIHTACQYLSSKSIELLIRHGAEVDVQDDNGETLLHILHDSPFGKPHKLIIEQLAKLFHFQGIINHNDLELIYRSPKMLAYYEKCLDKLTEEYDGSLYI